MAAQTTDQQNALKDAMARAKQIAAKLQQQQQQGDPDEILASEMEATRKRSLVDSTSEPVAKRNALDGVDHTDPKVIAQQIANSLVRRSGLGSMLVEEITIPNKLVGLVIGRGGEMINKLQTESGAKVQVAPDPPPNMPDVSDDRQITITGTTEAVHKAKNLIDEIRNGGKIPERLMAGTLPGEFSIEMSIPRAKVGLVIGKGGEMIKSLQERAGCKMMMFQDGEYANAPEKPLRVSGEQSTVMYGKQLIQDLLTSKELEGINPEKQHQGGQNYKEIDVPREAVGLIIGAKGANIHQIQMETGCRVQFKNDMEGATKTAMLTGNPQQLADAEAKLNEIISGNMLGPRGPRPQFNGAGPRPQWGESPGQQGPGAPQGWMSPGPRPFGGRNTNLAPDHKDMIIEVPANKCGLVIGKGGETIKLIKNETKVNIELSRDVSEQSPFKVFRVQGTDEMIEKTLGIIREKINDPSVIAKPADGSEPTPLGQNQWGASSPAPWGPQPQQNQQWNQQQQQQWPGQQQQQSAWGQHQQGAWNQQAQPQPGAQGWNQSQPSQQPTWDSQQQQWQQQNAAQQGQWPNQQQWAQPNQPYQALVPNSAQQNPHGPAQPGHPVPNASADPSQGTPQAAGQPDYSAAWALYYQQQQQYYQQYGMQQPAAVSTAAGTTASAGTPNVGTHAPTQTAGTPTSVSNPQAQAMAEYQAKLAEYYKQFGQQAPQ